MKVLFLAILAIHGLIHLMGFAKAFKFAAINSIKRPISKPVGALWLVCAFLFIAAAVFFFLEKQPWWMLAGAGVVLSHIVIALSWSDAKEGTLFNLIILIPVVLAFMSAQPSSFRNMYQAEVRKALKPSVDLPVVTEEDLEPLPEPVQKYLRYTGAIGKPKVRNFRARFTGTMKTKKDGNWLAIAAQQYDFFDDPARMFFIESSMYGLPFDGLHLYIGENATMQIKVASLIQVVNAKGREMNQGETVTLFNDMCLLAPASLLGSSIQWETIDPLTVKAVFTNKGNTITAQLYFNDTGELINFSSEDRYQSMDGMVYKKYKWTTPVKEYREYHGRRVAAYAEAVWHTPEGEFTYAKFDLAEIEYNVREFRMN